MLENYKRFDMKKCPNRQHFLPLIRLLSMPTLIRHKQKLVKENMQDIKPPYLFLGNHNSFLDFLVTFKGIGLHRSNFIASIDGFAMMLCLLEK